MWHSRRLNRLTDLSITVLQEHPTFVFTRPIFVIIIATGTPQHLLLLNNKHPLVPMSTLQAGYRLVLHGLSTGICMPRRCR